MTVAKLVSHVLFLYAFVVNIHSLEFIVGCGKQVSRAIAFLCIWLLLVNVLITSVEPSACKAVSQAGKVRGLRFGGSKRYDSLCCIPDRIFSCFCYCRAGNGYFSLQVEAGGPGSHPLFCCSSFHSPPCVFFHGLMHVCQVRTARSLDGAYHYSSSYSRVIKLIISLRFG